MPPLERTTCDALLRRIQTHVPATVTLLIARDHAAFAAMNFPGGTHSPKAFYIDGVLHIDVREMIGPKGETEFVFVAAHELLHHTVDPGLTMVGYAVSRLYSRAANTSPNEAWSLQNIFSDLVINTWFRRNPGLQKEFGKDELYKGMYLGYSSGMIYFEMDVLPSPLKYVLPIAINAIAAISEKEPTRFMELKTKNANIGPLFAALEEVMKDPLLWKKDLQRHYTERVKHLSLLRRFGVSI